MFVFFASFDVNGVDVVALTIRVPTLENNSHFLDSFLIGISPFTIPFTLVYLSHKDSPTLLTQTCACIFSTILIYILSQSNTLYQCLISNYLQTLLVTPIPHASLRFSTKVGPTPTCLSFNQKSIFLQKEPHFETLKCHV